MSELDRVDRAVGAVQTEHKQLVDLASRLASTRTTLRGFAFTAGLAMVGLGTSRNGVLVVITVLLVALVVAMIDGITEALYRHVLSRARLLEGVLVSYRDLLAAQVYQRESAERSFWEEFSRYEPGPYRRLPAVGLKAGLHSWLRRPLNYSLYGILVVAAILGTVLTGSSPSQCEQLVPSSVALTVDGEPVDIEIQC